MLAALVCVPTSTAAPTASSADDPVRILIMGDSMTQGSAGDWTWRYRLWQDLTASGADVDFVGPNDDLFDVTDGSFGSHDYVDPAFDQDHAARWGLSMAFPDEDRSITDLVSDYHPDVVVEMLGVNDLTWLQGTPDELISSMRTFVADGRAVDPGVDFVLGRIPQPWIDKVPPFNELLDDLAEELDTPAARVVSAASDAGMVRDQDTWDTFHPNSHGELKIAAGVADSLAETGVGQPVPRPLPLAQTPLGPRLRPSLTATGAVHGASLSWVRSPGAPEAEVWARDVTSGESWHQVGETTTDTSASLTALADWHRVQLKVLPVKGWRGADDAFSNVVEVEVAGDRLATPGLAVRASPDGSAALAWSPVAGATSYTVQWSRGDRPAAWVSQPATDLPRADVTGLDNRVSYVFRVRAERASLSGDFSTPAPATVPALDPVRKVRVVRVRRDQLRTSGLPVAAATSYTVLAVPAASCARAPRSDRFGVVDAGLAAPRDRFRIDATAVWVRWVAVRGGVEGKLSASSTQCLRLHR